MTPSSHPALHLPTFQREMALDGAATILRAALVAIAATIAVPFVLRTNHDLSLDAIWFVPLTGMALLAFLVVTWDQWRPVLLGLWWTAGANTGVLAESRQVLSATVRDPKAQAWAGSREVVGVLVWYARPDGWVLIDARLVEAAEAQGPFDAPSFPITAPHMPIHPQQHVAARFPHTGWRGAMARRIFRGQYSCTVVSSPFTLHSAHQRMAALALFDHPHGTP